MRLEGKVALITGAARGMGAVEARLFAEEGAKVCITDVDEEQGRSVAANITRSGGDVFFSKLDITSEDNWVSTVNEVVSRFGKLDVLVNNATINHVGTVEETTADDWDRVMEVNAKGAFLGTKAVIPFMRQAGGGSIINISSGAGLVGNRASTVYNASKAAVHILTKSTAIQYAREGIRANSVHPGATKSPMLANTGTLDSRFGVSVDDRIDSADPGALEETDRHYGNCFGISDYELLNRPMGRAAVPEEIGYGVVYLASDESTFMTGAQLVIDGGRQAG